MLRLAMWPTERLWESISVDLENQLGPQVARGSEASTLQSWDSKNSIQIAAHFRCGDYSYIKKDDYNSACKHDPALDVPSQGGEEVSAAVQERRSKESPYMASGTPIALGRCVGELVYNHTVLKQDLSLSSRRSDEQVTAAKAKIQIKNGSGVGGEKTRQLRRGSHHNSNNTQHYNPHEEMGRHHSDMYSDSTVRTLGEEEEPVALLYLTSDNPASAEQIHEYADKVVADNEEEGNKGSRHIPTILAPKGCHVDMDHSFECSLLTVSQWIILSSSDYIVTQTDKVGSPISAYSRYAAVYGLKGDSLRNSKDCGTVQSMYDISRRWNGNWFCD
jgi:hypothetical protein